MNSRINKRYCAPLPTHAYVANTSPSVSLNVSRFIHDGCRSFIKSYDDPIPRSAASRATVGISLRCDPLRFSRSRTVGVCRCFCCSNSRPYVDPHITRVWSFYLFSELVHRAEKPKSVWDVRKHVEVQLSWIIWIYIDSPSTILGSGSSTSSKLT